ncbi:MAG: aldo/keto reductase [Acidimicrobiia bacterium]|nr:aldo/keto reductase [Acidimicrobiia bacterium]
MKLRPLGRTGVRVSRLGLGTMVLGAWGNTDQDECVSLIRRAVDRGINLVDTADVYAFGESEEIVGRAIAPIRDEIVLATKFNNQMGPNDNHRGNTRWWSTRAVEASLRRLGTDRIDLYQVHRPDPDTDIAETLGALTDLQVQGKIVDFGLSTFPAEEIVEAHWAAERTGSSRPCTEQPPYSILTRGIERDVLPTCRRLGMGVITWSPLAGGWLTGKYNDGTAPAESRASTNPDHFDFDNDDKLRISRALADLAGEAGVSLTHLSLAWACEHPAVSSVLIGPRTPAQLDDLLGAADLELDGSTLDRIDELVPPGRSVNPADAGWTPPGLEVGERRRAR